MTCLALDDEPLALQLLASYTKRLPALTPQGFFNNPDEAHKRLSAGDIDLLFLDIQMPDISGLQFLKKLTNPPIVIFTTAYAEFAVEGFNLNAVDYLLKPFDFDRFAKAVNKAFDYRQFLNHQKNESATSLFVKVEYSIVQIPLDDIIFIEGFDDYIKIHTVGKPILTLLSLKNVLKVLPAQRFLRVHRSFIVAIDKIIYVRAQKIGVESRDIPVGATYGRALQSVLDNAPKKNSRPASG
ncbi:MAG: response regulator transcription factor [Saprospiraceae bacterium]|nr:response regulator transcription factor [Saprospiraceae bacterium]